MERVHLGTQGRQRWQHWRHHIAGCGAVDTINFGRLDDGRWYVEWEDDPEDAYVFPADAKESALVLAERWMTGADWYAV